MRHRVQSFAIETSNETEACLICEDAIRANLDQYVVACVCVCIQSIAFYTQTREIWNQTIW